MTQAKRLNILGVPVTPLPSVQAAASVIAGRIQSGQKTMCLSVNPEKIQHAARDARLRRILESADLQLCDGVGIVLAALALEHRRVTRCPGVDVFLELVRMAAVEGWGIFLLGASAPSNHAARKALLRLAPNLRISGSRNGYFDSSDDVVGEINASGAKLLFVAMGSPKQEFWMAAHLAKLRPLLCMGVGGSFDVIGGKTKRAPRVFRCTGTEWLFRLVADPGRWRRQMALPVFAFRVLSRWSRLDHRGVQWHRS